MRSLFLTTCAVIAVAPALAADNKPAIGNFGFDTAGMDRSVRPGDDFTAFAGGKYLQSLEIPADRSNFGMFTKLTELSQSRTRVIVEAAAAAASGREARKIGDYYTSFLDEAAIEALGNAPIKPALVAIAAIRDRSGLARAFGAASRSGIATPITVGLAPDRMDPDAVAPSARQSGLGLPDRDYYLDTTNPKFAEARTKYQAYIARLLTLAGYENADVRATAVYDLEAAIAATHWTRVESRQAEKTYNPVKRADLDRGYPGIDWTALLTAAGLDGQPVINIATPSAIIASGTLIETAPLSVWKDYLALRTIANAAPVLPKAFVDADFDFNRKTLGGQPEIQPRWKRGVDATSAAMGEAIVKQYTAKYFPPESKAKADELVKNIIAAMDSRLANLAWMDAATRVQAREKFAVFTPKIGYPDKWRDYSALQVGSGDAFANARRAAEFAYQRQLDKLGKRVDCGEWSMTPMTVNAFANFGWNEIVFPAAILQAPFFDANADPAINYGGIGAVIGHEISHHFDDQGRKYDKTGRLVDWWTKEDVTRFKTLTDKVVAQYGAYEPLPGNRVNGALTLGKNTADLAGITIAYDAWQRSLGGKPAPVIDGLTGEQRFFLGFSQVWRQKYRDPALIQQLVTDPHTPGHFRPYVVRNIDSFYSAFDAKPGDKMYLAPADRLKIW